MTNYFLTQLIVQYMDIKEPPGKNLDITKPSYSELL